MRTKKELFAGLIYDHSEHYLDHLAPFCSEMNCPLILCEPDLVALAKTFYPNLKIIESSLFSIPFPEFVISCDPPPLLKAAFPMLLSKTVWLPHGNSDKGPFFDVFEPEDIALVYGNQMIDRISLNAIKPKMIPVGNFRWNYFLKHKEFYKKTLQNALFQKGKKHILYAPTWDDAENNNSFWRAFEDLTQSFGSDVTLLVKLHPNTETKSMDQVEVLKKGVQDHIRFITNTPPIYPILEKIDGYIGDMSSIGYDFLRFEKPMFFYPSGKEIKPLQKCGQLIESNQFVFEALPEKREEQRKLYEYAFSDARFFQQTLTQEALLKAEG